MIQQYVFDDKIPNFQYYEKEHEGVGAGVGSGFDISIDGLAYGSLDFCGNGWGNGLISINESMVRNKKEGDGFGDGGFDDI